MNVIDPQFRPCWRRILDGRERGLRAGNGYFGERVERFGRLIVNVTRTEMSF